MPISAVAAYTEPISNDVTVAGVNLKGMTEAEARASILASVTPPPLTAITVVVRDRTYTLPAASAVVPNVDAILARAYETTTVPFEIQPTFLVNSTVIQTWVRNMARAQNRAPRNAVRSIRNRRLYVIPEIIGRRTDQVTGVARMRAAVASRIASPTAPQPRISIPVTRVNPRYTRRNIGKTIIVSQGEFKVFLYNNTRVEKIYRCAVGMRGYSTPNGNFRVIGKVKNPTWRNPGSDWATNMPAFIGPGPSNPLGTRALYINSPGIRIHGTSKVNSIGTRASHGCIRLTNPNVQDLYPRVPVGTPVFIRK